MLGFAPVSTAMLGGSGAARPVVNPVVSGVVVQVSLVLISVTANSATSEVAVRKPDTTFFYDPNNDGVGSFRNNEFQFISFAN